MRAADVADLLIRLPARVERVIAHPDLLGDPAALAPLGPRLVLENMNARKRDGRTAEELAAHFARLPEAGLCLDLAHVATVDPSLALADELLAAHGGRLRQLHVSGADPSGGHTPLTTAIVARYAPVLRRCREVPWILEREALPAV
jgi:sugar phosphate isomerase/epimerase